ncbi:hypothetical protein SDC9_51415 [bioreactor metagenome]|uniref:DUF4183 domain-containing protein n=1 Tax=bioreactor metagenome TaxID=1076179 RepID=A0A644WNB1_9ZZZZ
MATSLLKLTMTATKPTTTAEPAVTNFFHTSTGHTGAVTYTIDDTAWVDDSGTQLLEGGLVPAIANNGYYQLYINGELQEGDVVETVTTTAVTITFGETTTIDAGKIVALVVTNFQPDTSAPTITG